jgi:hypothetical protein
MRKSFQKFKFCFPQSKNGHFLNKKSYFNDKQGCNFFVSICLYQDLVHLNIYFEWQKYVKVSSGKSRWKEKNWLFNSIFFKNLLNFLRFLLYLWNFWDLKFKTFTFFTLLSVKRYQLSQIKLVLMLNVIKIHNFVVNFTILVLNID